MYVSNHEKIRDKYATNFFLFWLTIFGWNYQYDFCQSIVNFKKKLTTKFNVKRTA